MLKLRVDPAAVTNPDLLGLANLNFRMLFHERDLHLEFLRKPQIVRIEKRQITSARGCLSPVPRCRYASLRLLDQAQM